MAVRRLARFVLVSRDAERLARFFTEALGFARAATSGPDIELALGPSRVTIEHRPDALPYPAAVPGWHPLFQHCAIVVADMDAAYRRLRGVAGWTPISTDGPARLPASSGGVTAFKFRAPDGHPLELLAFPDAELPPAWAALRGADPCLGIDHSAISVAETGASVTFYEGLGLTLGPRSLNAGPEQAALDGVADPTLEVTGLMPEETPPHLELLCYRGDFARPMEEPALGSVAATRLVFAVGEAGGLEAVATAARNGIVESSAGALLLRDPDGHLMEFTSR